MNTRLLIATLVALLFLSGCQDPQPSAPSASPTVNATAIPAGSGTGESCPPFELTGADGSKVSFDGSKNPDEEVTLIFFWSYRWDPNVATFLQRASELHERYAPRGLNIIAISYDEEPTGLRGYLDKNPVPFQVAVGTQSIYEKFKIEDIPTGILVDKNGKTARRWKGHFSTEEMSETLSPFLPGRSGNS